MPSKTIRLSPAIRNKHLRLAVTKICVVAQTFNQAGQGAWAGLFGEQVTCRSRKGKELEQRLGWARDTGEVEGMGDGWWTHTASLGEVRTV